MRSRVVDKIASVALANDIGREARISPDIPCEEGVLVAAEVLNNKSRYNTLELTSGRMAQVKRGDVIVGALGHRAHYPPAWPSRDDRPRRRRDGQGLVECAA